MSFSLHVSCIKISNQFIFHMRSTSPPNSPFLILSPLTLFDANIILKVIGDFLDDGMYTGMAICHTARRHTPKDKNIKQHRSARTINLKKH